MSSYLSHSPPAYGDQADGLRRLFAGSRQRLVPVAFNAHVDCAGVVLERLSAAFTELGARTLVVDAADNAPLPSELVDIDIGAAIETLGPSVSYLAARGLPLRHVNPRGSCAGWLAAVEDAAPQTDVILLHANARDLVRLIGDRDVCPVLLTSLLGDSLTDAYASMKLLSQRAGLMAFDLMVGMKGRPKRAQRMAERLGSCADSFLGAVLRQIALIDCNPPHNAAAGPALSRLAGSQLLPRTDDGSTAASQELAARSAQGAAGLSHTPY
ncbi:MAG TPA: flagellar biosynthesis protein [Ideonella sp.]|nr:flagellar biosynthesis protein [Ideonella sp.]